jgi:hypothetical protein
MGLVEDPWEFAGLSFGNLWIAIVEMPNGFTVN